MTGRTPLGQQLRHRLRAAGIHLLISSLLVGLASWVVFRLWYPPPYAATAGGLSLFALLMGVDLTLGPALTTVVAAPGKARRLLVRDLVCIGTLQIAALGYGVYTMALARPVVFAFEVDQMRLVSAAEIDPAALADAPEGLRSLSWSGPRLIAARKPTELDQLWRSIELGMAGIDLAMQPRHWVPYETQRDAVWRAAKPLAPLAGRSASTASEVAALAASVRLPVDGLRYLPVHARQPDWIAVFAGPDARVVGHLRLDGVP